jgi:hypothetical protein
MKGPSGRGKFDVRRRWECPNCKRRAYTSGQVVNLACDCGDRLIPERTIWMCLLEEKASRPWFKGERLKAPD